MRAFVFINKTITPGGLGHVGWAIETSPGEFCYGSKETTGAGAVFTPPGQPNKAFFEHANEKTMLSRMASGDHGGSGFPYHAYKVVDVASPEVRAGERLAHDTPNWGYAPVLNNCMDDVFKIIKAYAGGNDTILPWPSTHPAPAHFFADIPGREIPL